MFCKIKEELNSTIFSSINQLRSFMQRISVSFLPEGILVCTNSQTGGSSMTWILLTWVELQAFRSETNMNSILQIPY